MSREIRTLLAVWFLIVWAWVHYFVGDSLPIIGEDNFRSFLIVASLFANYIFTSSAVVKVIRDQLGESK